MEFIRKVWGGHDYIPYVWDEWMADKKSVLDVVEVDGKPVGIGRLRFLDDGTGWLEGARVHPDFRGRGLASEVGRALMRVGRGKGVTEYRLTSGSRNKTAHRQIAKLGFREISRVSVYEAAKVARFKPQRGVRVAREADATDVLRMIESSREYKVGGGVYWDGFSATALKPAVIARLIRGGSVYLSEGAVAISRLGGEGEAGWRQVCFVAGAPEGATTLLKHAYGKKEATRTTWKLAYMPQGSHLVAALRGMGMKRSWSLVLFEGKDSKD